MALRKRTPEVIPEVIAPPEPPRSLVASAARIKLDGQAWRTWRFGDDGWQQEAWRLYDIIGELRFVANWIGSELLRELTARQRLLMQPPSVAYHQPVIGDR